MHAAPAFDGSLVHRSNESVELALATSGCVQSEALLSSNSSEPARPWSATSYVPVRGATIVISNEDGADLKKTSPVDRSTPTAGSFFGAKGTSAKSDGKMSWHAIEGHSEPYSESSHPAESKAGLPVHAQRMSALFASDKDVAKNIWYIE